MVSNERIYDEIDLVDTAKTLARTTLVRSYWSLFYEGSQ